MYQYQGWWGSLLCDCRLIPTRQRVGISQQSQSRPQSVGGRQTTHRSTSSLPHYLMDPHPLTRREALGKLKLNLEVLKDQDHEEFVPLHVKHVKRTGNKKCQNCVKLAMGKTKLSNLTLLVSHVYLQVKPNSSSVSGF